MAKGAYMYRGAQKKIISGVIRGGGKRRGKRADDQSGSVNGTSRRRGTIKA